jgi:stage III sporulation protein AH
MNMRVVCVNKKSALYGLLLVVMVLVGGYVLVANHIQAAGSAPVPASDKTAGNQQQAPQPANLLPTMPDLTKEEFFVDCRLDRDRARSEQMETLNEIAGQSDSSGAVRDSAQREMMQLSEDMTRETELEQLVMARGYNDDVVMILPQSATVVIQTRSLPPPVVEQIKTLVAKTTGMDAGSVSVIPKP